MTTQVDGAVADPTTALLATEAEVIGTPPAVLPVETTPADGGGEAQPTSTPPAETPASPPDDTPAAAVPPAAEAPSTTPPAPAAPPAPSTPPVDDGLQRQLAESRRREAQYEQQDIQRQITDAIQQQAQSYVAAGANPQQAQEWASSMIDSRRQLYEAATQSQQSVANEQGRVDYALMVAAQNSIITPGQVATIRGLLRHNDPQTMASAAQGQTDSQREIARLTARITQMEKQGAPAQGFANSQGSAGGDSDAAFIQKVGNEDYDMTAADHVRLDKINFG